MNAPAFANVWGLTGGVASGKTAVAKLLRAKGFTVIDADRISRELSQPGGLAHQAIIARFGTADRARLRELVFADPAARADLEKILHPLIRTESLKLAQAAPAGDPIIYEAALLVETGRYRDFRGLIVVDAPRALRRERLTARDGIPAEMADRILAAQTDDESRREAATHVLVNDGSLEELARKVESLTPLLK